MELSSDLFGAFLTVAGGLAVVNHPVVDAFNRSMKAWGTSRSASDIEMSTWSILFGRIAGAVIAVVGLALLLGGLA